MNTFQVINNVVPSALVSDNEVEFEYQVSSQHLLNAVRYFKVAFFISI